MKKLKLILRSNTFFLLLSITLFFYTLLSFVSTKTKYQKTETLLEGTILSKKIYENYSVLEINGKEKVLVQYSFSSKQQIDNLKIGDTIILKGTLEIPSRNRNFHLFNYQQYLKGKQIFWIVKADTISLKKRAKGFLLWKDKLIRKIQKRKQAPYYFSFLLGDSSKIAKKNWYQELGISHLFAISGMHILFLANLLSKLFQKLCSKKLVCFFCTVSVLTLYVFLLSDSPSANRAYLLYIFSFFNQYYKLELSSFRVLFYVASIAIFRNPFVILQIGFQFSFLICAFFLLKKKDAKGYIKDLFATSWLAFFASIPLSLYHFHQIHFGTILFNMITVPLVTTILFPLSFLSFFLPVLEGLYGYFIFIFEQITETFQIFNFLKFNFQAVSILFILAYYSLLTLGILKNKKFYIFFFGLLLIHFWLPYFSSSYWIDVIDIKEGDAILIRYPHLKRTILVDCGGQNQYAGNRTSDVDNTLIPYFKTLGVKKIDVLILSHGDYDHIGNAIPLVEKFEVKKVIFNCGAYNDLEKELIKVLEKKKIPYYSCVKEFKIANDTFYFLNTKEYDGENDNSSVIYTKLNHYKILFMGDAGIKKEKDILKQYHVSNVDILKVGHHGSRTSSSKEFIDAINPKYAMISVGKNNRYGLPNIEVLENLALSKVYRTDRNGGIQIKINQKGLNIKTCNP